MWAWKGQKWTDWEAEWYQFGPKLAAGSGSYMERCSIHGPTVLKRWRFSECESSKLASRRLDEFTRWMAQL